MEDNYEGIVSDLDFAAKTGDRDLIAEALERVDRMYSFAAEDRGWVLLTGSNVFKQEEGPDLESLKSISKQLREEAVGNPLIKRGIGLRKSYVFSKGVNIPGFEHTPTGGRGRPSKATKFFRDPVNQKQFIDSSKREELESAAFTDGVVLHVGDKSSNQVRQIPLTQIVGVATDPEFPSEIVAFKRQWQKVEYRDGQQQSETQVFWYYSDTFSGTKEKFIDETPVKQNSVIFHQMFNSQSGWTWGSPDALSAVVWSRMYSELVNYGKAMTKTMAMFAGTLTSKKSSTAAMAGRSLAENGGGGIASIGQDQQFAALATAGKTYDFEGLRPIAAMVATALEVSVVHLLSDPGAAGSSYGSAQNLDLPTKRSIVARQDVWASYFERIIRWATGDSEPVTFPALEDPDPYREMQNAVLAYNTGLIHPDEMRPRVMKVSQVEALHDNPPEGTVAPNPSAGISTSPDQGRSNGTGGAGKTLGNDIPED